MVVVEEDIENRIILLQTPKREKRIKLYYPRLMNNAFWMVSYEDGTTVSEELSGGFTNKQFALKALNAWEESVSMTPNARYKDKTPPVLKTKGAPRGAAANSENG